VVAEGTIYDSGMCSMTWLSKHPTLTVFDKITTVKEVHGHGGRTEVIVQDQDDRFEDCRAEARMIKSKDRNKKKKDGKRK